MLLATRTRLAAIVLAGVLSTTTSACAHRGVRLAAPHDTLIRRHSVFVDEHGRPVRSLTGAERDTLSASARGFFSDDEYDVYVREILRGVRAHPTKRILIYVHGGMVSLEGGRDNAIRLRRTLSDAGYYPVFINWSAAPLATYRDHLLWVRQGQVYRFWGPVTSPFYLTADLGRGIVRAPITVFHQFADYCRTTSLCPLPGSRERQRTDALTDSLIAAEARREDSLAVFQGDFRPTGRENAGRIAAAVLTLPTKLVTGVLIDAGGTSAWGNMLRRTQTMFRRPGEFRVAPDGERGYRPASGAVALLMDSLSAVVRQDSAYRVTLIGHSMGTIVANHILRDYDLRVSEIVYMAAACSISDMEGSVIPYMRLHPQTQFYNLTLHPLADARERNVADIIPRGSLLEWIDDYLSTPNAHLDRTLGKWVNAIEAAHIFPDAVRGRVHMKAFGYRDPSAPANAGFHKPAKHGAFNDVGVEFWRRDFWEPPANRAMRVRVVEATTDTTRGSGLAPLDSTASHGNPR